MEKGTTETSGCTQKLFFLKDSPVQLLKIVEGLSRHAMTQS